MGNLIPLAQNRSNSTRSVEMSVVGFDIGNENCVIAVVKQRGEKTDGQEICRSGCAKELKMLPFETFEGPDGGILIRLKYLGESHTFTPVQIMAMLFAHLKEIAEQRLEMPISDCVIGIPSYFTDLQRRAYLNSATIAGLNPLRLMHDCTATALSYGIYKTDFPSSGPTYVAFVDIGHCDTQVSISSFETGRMRILSHTFDMNLGGRDFDEVLFTYFASQFKEQYGIDVYSNPKACLRLRAACEKLKKVLSANPEAPLNIECLMEETDVKGFIKREEFERLASGLLERISIPCKKALADAGLAAERIHSVELVGSGSRIPAITRLLASLFRREPSRKLNASECVARGCALQCAMLSPVFRVREYEVQDIIPFSIGFASEEGPIGTGSNGVLFPRCQPIPSVKVLSFQRTNSFHLEAFYCNPHELPPGVSPKISLFTLHGEKIRIKVKVQLNLHGIVRVESATLVEDHVDDSVSKGNPHSNMDKMDVECASSSGSSDMVVDGVEDSTSVRSKSSRAYILLRVGISPVTVAHFPRMPFIIVLILVRENLSFSIRAQFKNKTLLFKVENGFGIEEDDGTRKDKVIRRIEIPVSETVYGGMTTTELSEAQEKEIQLAKQDRAMEQTKEKKNALESYVYDMRNKFVIVSLSGWGLLFFSRYKFFTGGKGKKAENSHSKSVGAAGTENMEENDDYVEPWKHRRFFSERGSLLPLKKSWRKQNLLRTNRAFL
ncbi:Heat shock 70 kDa protein 16 [Morella rubra]|uniref:Heat shock 70 kDa protein 16 n=1 Tax=Morella rubra TaxID=262757 RepID=A0A6A1WLM8_9ROSI|nr:Heat shock 70 kDa protein 16 [Morella rubra]